MGKRKKTYHDGELVTDFLNRTFQKDLRDAELGRFPDQQRLTTPLDEVVWMLWVIFDHFEHRSPIYASEYLIILSIVLLSTPRRSLISSRLEGFLPARHM